MAGIYIHIPFCKVKCHYCDFHFSTNVNGIENLLVAILNEINIQKKYLGEERIETIYFGGGTPSLIGSNAIDACLNQIRINFNVLNDAEITLECNPDDLSLTYLKELKTIGVNRLSIGIQSFDDEVLKFMNRAHNSQEAKKCLDDAKKIGFDNITLDLIYGIPNTDINYWQNQLNIFYQFEVPHLSAYCLTIEKKTVFGLQQAKGTLKAMDDALALDQFEYLMDSMSEKGYEQYEISNFSKEGYISKHNSAYWKGTPYLGIGPSAHSYNGNQRQWNISNNNIYVKSLKENRLDFEIEELSSSDKFNDYILTRLRTKWGINIDELSVIGNVNKISEELSLKTKEGLLINQDDSYFLTKEGKFLADAICADLFI